MGIGIKSWSQYWGLHDPSMPSIVSYSNNTSLLHLFLGYTWNWCSRLTPGSRIGKLLEDSVEYMGFWVLNPVQQPQGKHPTIVLSPQPHFYRSFCCLVWGHTQWWSEITSVCLREPFGMIVCKANALLTLPSALAPLLYFSSEENMMAIVLSRVKFVSSSFFLCFWLGFSLMLNLRWCLGDSIA